MSCLACTSVVDSSPPPNTGVRAKERNKKVSTNGEEVYVEEKDTNTAGTLKLKVGSVAYTWKKVRVVVDDRYFMIYEKKKGKPSSQFPLQLCNVRPLSSRRFRVLCAPNKSEEFRAKDNKQLREWITIIQEGIARQLSVEPAGNQRANTGLEILAALRKGNNANTFCADCNAPDPKWVSINIGCIICIECSGVHRQLGVTISKVRSFELDMWGDKIGIIEKLGNAGVNSAYEARLPSHTKPRVDADREEREKYIYDKYVSKLYRRKSDALQPILNNNTPADTLRKKSITGVVLMPHTNYGSPSSNPSSHRSGQSTNNNGSSTGTPNQKRIHIGSDVFEILEAQAGANYHPYRRPSFGFDITRRGSYAGTATTIVLSPPQSPEITPTPASSPTSVPAAPKKRVMKENTPKHGNSILEQRRFSLFQAR